MRFLTNRGSSKASNLSMFLTLSSTNLDGEQEEEFNLSKMFDQWCYDNCPFAESVVCLLLDIVGIQLLGERLAPVLPACTDPELGEWERPYIEHLWDLFLEAKGQYGSECV